jgi:hypothetical protein
MGPYVVYSSQLKAFLVFWVRIRWVSVEKSDEIGPGVEMISHGEADL